MGDGAEMCTITAACFASMQRLHDYLRTHGLYEGREGLACDVALALLQDRFAPSHSDRAVARLGKYLMQRDFTASHSGNDAVSEAIALLDRLEPQVRPVLKASQEHAAGAALLLLRDTLVWEGLAKPQDSYETIVNTLLVFLKEVTAEPPEQLGPFY